MYSFTPRTIIKSAEINANFQGLADGTFDEENNSMATFRSESLSSYVTSGLVWSGDNYGASRAASMTAGVIYIAGVRHEISAVSSRTFTASKDTYVDVDSTGALVYTEVTNNAASPALASGSVRIAIIVTGASSIASVASINQGQPTKALPTGTNTYRSGCDSLGNRIRPESRNGIIHFMNNGAPGATTTSTSYVDTASGDMTVVLAEAMDLVVDAALGVRWSGTPAVASYAQLLINSVAYCADTRLDWSVSGTPGTFLMNGRARLAAGSYSVKIQFKAGAGTSALTAFHTAINIKAMPTSAV